MSVRAQKKSSIGAGFVLFEHKITESERLACFGGHIGKKLAHDPVKVFTPHGIKIVFAVASSFDQAGDSQECQVMADRWLTLVQPLAKGRNVQFAFPHEVHQDSQPSLVRQEFECLDKILFELIWQSR